MNNIVQLHLQSSIRVRNYGERLTCIEISLFKRDLIGVNEVEMIEILL